MKRISIIILSTLFATSALAPSASAQLMVQSGAFTRISSGGHRSEGKLISATADSIWLANGSERIALSAHADSVWVLQRQIGKGMAVGAVTGGLTLGTLAGLLAVGLCETTDCSSAFPGGFVVGAAMGAGGGGVVGALIGSLVREWRRVVP